MSGLFTRARMRAGAFLLALLFSAHPGWAAETAPGEVTGNVGSVDGAPIGGAFVVLQGRAATRSSQTDSAGGFSVTGLPPGTYSVRVLALGYSALSPRTIEIEAARTTHLALSLVRSASSLATIGRVQTSGGDALSTSSAPTTTLDSQAYAAEGYTRLSDVLQNDISATLVHPLGGSTVLPTSVALRGPDPTETLIDVDGHQVNNGNTGDFDLSLLDPADYGPIELVKGISPSSLVGPDTIDGAINIRTLEPTATPHGLARFAFGSFNAFSETLQSTGTIERLGYALSLHRTTTSGEVNQPIFDTTTGNVAQVGSAVDGSTALGKIRYAFGRGGDGYAELSFRDQSIFRDLSAGLSSYSAPPDADLGSDSARRRTFDSGQSAGSSSPQDLPALAGFEGTTLQAHNAGYGFDVRTPLGAPDASGIARTSALFRHYTSLVSQSVFGSGADTSPYLYDDRDFITDDSLELERQFSRSSVTLQYAVRNESLATDFAAGVVNDESIARRSYVPAARAVHVLDATGDGDATANAISQLTLGQTQRSALLRYIYDPTPTLHVTAAAYYSAYSIFGHALDPRFGFTYTPDARSAFRFSLGTTYQSPQLPELFVPSILPPAVGGYISVGNPNLQPDRATEYGIGASHVFETGPHRTDVSADFYRVNLRTPASIYLPPLDPDCGAVAAGGDGKACPLSYPINAGDAIYEGIEFAAERRLAPAVTLRAGWAVRSAFLTSVPAAIQDGTLVPGEQSSGLPLDKATLVVRAAPATGPTYAAGLTYEGPYNELNQPPFTVLDASIGYRWPAFEIGLAATNLSNVYDQRFTRTAAGVPYAGLAGPLATDAYALQGTAVTFTLTRRF